MFRLRRKCLVTYRRRPDGALFFIEGRGTYTETLRLMDLVVRSGATDVTAIHGKKVIS